MRENTPKGFATECLKSLRTLRDGAVEAAAGGDNYAAECIDILNAAIKMAEGGIETGIEPFMTITSIISLSIIGKSDGLMEAIDQTANALLFCAGAIISGDAKVISTCEVVTADGQGLAGMKVGGRA